VPRWEKIARRIRVPLGFLLALIYVWLCRPTLSSILTGSMFVVLGITARALASGYLKKNEQLATSGPYAYTRNPLYLGSISLAIGFGMAGRNLWIFLFMIIFFLLIYVPVIRAEEELLRARFLEFEDYARRVPRLWPRWNGPTGGSSFSWELYRKHREYNAALGSILLLMILVAKTLWYKK
jgi:protein-S-isoprenylcysteine O-methyltransferase Ste14